MRCELEQDAITSHTDWVSRLRRTYSERGALDENSEVDCGIESPLYRSGSWLEPGSDDDGFRERWVQSFPPLIERQRAFDSVHAQTLKPDT